jgi:ElaB/YqjD/DUF883 family membrane-anchored ribosome-binding protein
MDRTETNPDELVIPRVPARREDHAPARAATRGAVVDEIANGRPDDPEEMRAEIERTRQRMSTTLDVLEDRLVRQKQELWAKATLQGFRRTLAREPWRSVAIAFVVGYVVAAIRD